MIPDIRQSYNSQYTDEKYRKFLEYISAEYNHVPQFRIAETPVFVPPGLKNHLFKACQEIADVICDHDFKRRSAGALMPNYQVPNEDEHTIFLQMDFGITRTAEGELLPKLIEVQGFPSLYFYQDLVARAYREFFEIPDSMSHLFHRLTSEEYIELMRRVIIGDEDPRQVVLLEVEPFKQVTQIDFLGAAKLLGLHVACVTDLKKRGNKAYYIDEHGKEVQVKRIFNRVIFDELLMRNDLPREFRFTDEVDVTWVGHPNWFFRISKYTLPILHSYYSPKTWYLDQIEEIPEDLENYVVKPLYSFAGAGVIIDVDQEQIDAIPDPQNYILQEKVHYDPVVATPDEGAKCEIRMLLMWEPGSPGPRIVNNLARLSKGKMIGVKYNKNKTWVGGSVAFF